VSLHDTLFLHVPYHPANPPLRKIQETFSNMLLYPQAATPLLQIRNLHEGVQWWEIKKLIIAGLRTWQTFFAPAS
jgi:hypothetical protein